MLAACYAGAVAGRVSVSVGAAWAKKETRKRGNEELDNSPIIRAAAIEKCKIVVSANDGEWLAHLRRVYEEKPC